jgi:large subunit ribosomal protein L10
VIRAEKTVAVEKTHETFEQTPHVILASYRGLTVNQANELRAKIAEVGGSYRVIKNRLAKMAATGTPAEGMSELFSGPCAIATHESDPVGLAKALAEFAKANPQIELLAGVIDAKDILDAKDVKRLASLPGLQELRAQLLALLQTPATTLLRLVNTPGSQVARVLDARREKLEESSEG